MKALATVAVMAAFLTGATGWVGADERSAASSHRSTGIVVAISSTGLTMLIEDHGRHRHVLGIDPTTRIVLGAGTSVGSLGVGDYIAEECVPDGKGGLRAVKLVLHRPAWMALASPEE